jgi:transcription antitermination factor NusA-like protein
MGAFPLEFFNFITDVQSFKIDNKTKSRNKMKLLNNLKLTDIRGKIINTKGVKIKIIQTILKENIKGLFWKVILQFPNNLTCKISVLVSTFCTHCKNFVHSWIDF